MKARVYVTLKEGVLDPQGKAVEHALDTLGYRGVKEVRVGKFFELDLTESDSSRAKMELAEMCTALLANTVIEDFRFEIVGD